MLCKVITQPSDGPVDNCFRLKNKNLKEFVILRLTHILAAAVELGLLAFRLLMLFLHWKRQERHTNCLSQLTRV